jgi:hypothetical protein
MTLTGTNFAPGAVVIIGSTVETRVTVVSATSITCTIYGAYIPLAGSVLISVRNGGGSVAAQPRL